VYVHAEKPAMTDPIIIEDEMPQVIPGDGSAVAVPSGQAVTFLDLVLNAPGTGDSVARFRFIAPAIAKTGGTVDSETASADMAALCAGFALPRITAITPAPSQVIISFSDKPVPFGEATPDVTQFFEAYTIKDNACIWEAF
jgi:hypothetical protein